MKAMLDLLKLRTRLGEICCEAGEIIREGALQQSFAVESKSFNNLVTEIDKKTEEYLVQHLKSLLPDAGFIAEEGTGEKKEKGPNWIIDPLDGTTNFVHNIPMYCISVALEDKGKLTVAAIYAPMQDELFLASLNGGATLNGAPISVSKQRNLSTSLLATGFPYDDFEFEKEYFDILKLFTHNTRGIRRLGSAAIDLAYVACGRFESFYEYGLNPWDVAAGILIVQEAGGVCTDFKMGNDMLYGEEIIASNPHIHEDIQRIINQCFTRYNN